MTTKKRAKAGAKGQEKPKLQRETIKDLDVAKGKAGKVKGGPNSTVPCLRQPLWR